MAKLKETDMSLNPYFAADLLCDLGFEFPYLLIGRIALPVSEGMWFMVY